MPLPTINDVQAVDPVLTNMLVGYMQSDDRFVALRVFPPVSVEKDSGTYYIYDKKYWFLDDLEERSPGAPFVDLNIGVSTATYKTLQWAGQHPIADEVRANSQVPGDLEERAVINLAQRNLVRIERAFAADFMVTGVWDTTNTTATDWDDFSAGDPVSDILTAVRTISQSTGKSANTLVVGHIVHNALINHPDIIDRVKYTQSASSGNVASALAAAVDIANYLPAKASYNSANEGQAATMAGIIDDDALVLHVDAGAGIFGASAGKTFVWEPGGGQGQVFRVRDEQNHRDLAQIKAQWDQKAVASDLGYLFTDIV